MSHIACFNIENTICRTYSSYTEKRKKLRWITINEQKLLKVHFNSLYRLKYDEINMSHSDI